jgi:hypothetical protein
VPNEVKNALSSRAPGEEYSRVLRYGVSGGAKPLCRESKGVPSVIVFSTFPAWRGGKTGDAQ